LGYSSITQALTFSKTIPEEEQEHNDELFNEH